MRAAQNGDREALTRVIRGLQPLAHRLALRFFSAEDAAQEVLIQMVTKLDRFACRSGFTTWAYRVATNKFLSISRARGDEPWTSVGPRTRSPSAVMGPRFLDVVTDSLRIVCGSACAAGEFGDIAGVGPGGQP